ncbi:unnamed protein product [Protopolystoma xenopodis]|uniref:Secreted protein n=1 Tax=Protopolystoma xenopodis TaxID=117903 RepID=A0A3S5BQK2_9PLAT|nr:unnamed protein product [Protopolystoma xenopodis]
MLTRRRLELTIFAFSLEVLDCVLMRPVSICLDDVIDMSIALLLETTGSSASDSSGRLESSAAWAEMASKAPVAAAILAAVLLGRASLSLTWTHHTENGTDQNCRQKCRDCREDDDNEDVPWLQSASSRQAGLLTEAGNHVRLFGEPVATSRITVQDECNQLLR